MWKYSSITPLRELYLVTRVLGLLIIGDVVNFWKFFDESEYYVRKYSYIDISNQ